MPDRQPESAIHRYRLRVFYEDTDASGVVYHANYLKYFERARTLWLEAHGHSHRELADARGVAFTLARLNMQFVAPARLDDTLEVTTQVVEHRRVSIVFGQEIHCRQRLLIQAQFTVACVRIRDFRPCALPEFSDKEKQ